jgi:hypothetical protein
MDSDIEDYFEKKMGANGVIALKKNGNYGYSDWPSGLIYTISITATD